MKQFLGIFVAGLLWAASLTARAKVNVFACEPEWAELAAEIGGDKVQAFSATHAKQDPHHIRARPSLIAKVRNADLILCSGAGLEIGGWPEITTESRGRSSAWGGWLSDGSRICASTGEISGGGSQYERRASGR